MPTIRIEMLQGRSQETKQEIAIEITALMGRILGADPSHVYVQFEEWAPSNWSVGGKFLGAATASAEAGSTGDAQGSTT